MCTKLCIGTPTETLTGYIQYVLKYVGIIYIRKAVAKCVLCLLEQTQEVFDMCLLSGAITSCASLSHVYTSPQATILTGVLTAPDLEPCASMALSTSIPSTTFPKTTCFPSRKSVTAVVMKN